MKYRGEIDGLRAIAVLPVVFFHAGFNVFAGGFVGVDVFFVISGYLITSILIHELEVGGFSISKFYERRARRILPALFSIMLFSFVFAWALLGPSDMKSFSGSMGAVPLFFSNIFFWLQSGYFDTASEIKPLIHTWSLAVEEQFYVIFPIFLYFIWSAGRRSVFLILFFFFFLSLFFSVYGWYHFPSAAFFTVPTRAWELIIGSLAALVVKDFNFERLNKGILNTADFAGIGLIFLAVFVYDERTPFPSFYAFMPTLGTVMVILFSSSDTWTGRVLGSRPFVWIGLISYSIYLWHQPIFAFARLSKVDGRPNAMMMLFLVSLTIFVAYLSWRYIETPFRNSNNINRRQLTLFALFGSLFFIIAGLAGYRSDGWRDFRMGADQIRLMETVKFSPKRGQCHTGGNSYTPPESACVFFSDRVAWAVLGDSHGVELSYALANLLKVSGVGVKQLTFSACAPSYNLTNLKDPCARWMKEALDYLDRSPEVNNVVVTFRLNQYLFGKHDGFYPDFPDLISAGDRVETWKSYVAILNHLHASGKRVVVVLQAPELRRRIDELIFRGTDFPKDIVGSSLKWWLLRNEFVYKNLPDIPAGVDLIDPRDVFCDDVSCYATRHGVSLYFDSDHMSVGGADLIAAKILERN